jgi:hypothetical protein
MMNKTRIAMMNKKKNCKSRRIAIAMMKKKNCDDDDMNNNLFCSSSPVCSHCDLLVWFEICELAHSGE